MGTTRGEVTPPRTRFAITLHAESTPMENLPLATLDVVLLLVLLVGAWRGFTKGLILSMASMVGLVGGIWAASHFSHMVAEQLAPHVTWSVNSLHMASLALTFLLVVVTVHLLAKLLEKMLDLVALGLVNKLAGALFGLLKFALVLSFGVMLLNQWMGPRAWVPHSEQPSVMLGPVEALAPALMPAFSDLERRARESGLPPATEDAP
ncbi:MAG: colicin V production protein [Stappia sp.]|nr:colicin V production protein [Stappia sp.]